MIEKYSLIEETLPTLPTPHDCVISQIELDDQFIVFYFENNIASHDSIEAIHPNAKSLIIRYHLTKYKEYAFYRWHRGIRLLFPSGYYKEMKKTDVQKLPLSRLEYLYQHVDYSSVIITLFSGGYIILHAEIDDAEYEWIE